MEVQISGGTYIQPVSLINIKAAFTGLEARQEAFLDKGNRMAIYDDLKSSEGIASLVGRLTQLGSKVALKQKTFGDVPNDYIDFLTHIGFGEIGNSDFMLYGGLLKPEEVFGDSDPRLSNLLLLGDDFQGFNTAFDTRDWSIVEIDPTNFTRMTVGHSFESFIRAKIAASHHEKKRTHHQ